MSATPKPAVPAVEVPDAAEAMRKAIEFGRRVLAVPKPAANGQPKSIGKPTTARD